MGVTLQPNFILTWAKPCISLLISCPSSVCLFWTGSVLVQMAGDCLSSETYHSRAVAKASMEITGSVYLTAAFLSSCSWFQQGCLNMPGSEHCPVWNPAGLGFHICQQHLGVSAVASWLCLILQCWNTIFKHYLFVPAFILQASVILDIDWDEDLTQNHLFPLKSAQHKPEKCHGKFGVSYSTGQRSHCVMKLIKKH